MDLNKVIAMNIRAFRKHHKLTQKELAERVDITRCHLNDIEHLRKNVSIQTLERIANKLEVEPYQLLK
ncbi:helix-turn-helix domain-containing protein [Macrococcoides caseolyticum]|uniref:helix-turn-helix domain-containing protein n=1 Tax=Macrococcoides caseolyticum TaxID=69966 RepID=UPI0018E2AE92|nr:helix-turn-helix transcriptional regulator [Macrococcus caseolyticus]